MRQRLSPISPTKRVAVAAAVAALLAVTASPTLANGFNGAKASSKVTTIYIKGSSTNSLRFVGPKTVKLRFRPLDRKRSPLHGLI